jgi:putative ABC transport system substrate-binding protein
MKRREFIAATVALLVSPRRLCAQGARRRLGFLALGDESGQAPNQAELALFDGLRKHGWIDGKDLIVEYRFSQPPDRLSASVADLIALNPDVLIVAGPQATIALKSATDKIPIVFVAVADPVGLGLVQSLSRPGGNMTGFATSVPEDFPAKRIEILREIVPSATKIALLVNPDSQMQRLVLTDHLPRTLRKLEKLGVAVIIVEATKAEELDVAFASAAAQHAEAIIDLGDPLTYVHAPRINALAAKYHLPANYYFRHAALAADCRPTGPIYPICSAVQAATWIRFSKAPSLPICQWSGRPNSNC